MFDYLSRKHFAGFTRAAFTVCRPHHHCAHGEGRMLKAQQFTATLNGGGPPVRLISEHSNVYLRAL